MYAEANREGWERTQAHLRDMDRRMRERGGPPASLWVYPLDHHPNEVAHRLAAESLAPAVRALAGSPRS